MVSEVDVHVGKRLRRRRRLLGLTQQNVADAIGMRFQQVQKYECGANRMTVERLHQISAALSVPATYFFDGLPNPLGAEQPISAANDALNSADLLGQEETIELVRAYYLLGERPRRKLLELAKAMRNETLAVA